MTAFLQISTNFSALNFPPHDCLRKQRLLGLKVSEPITIRNLSRRKIRLVYKYWLKTGVSERKLTFFIVNRIKDGTFIGEDGWKKSKRVLLVRFNGLGSGGGGYGCGEQKRFFRFWAREEKKKRKFGEFGVHRIPKSIRYEFEIGIDHFEIEFGRENSSQKFEKFRFQTSDLPISISMHSPSCLGGVSFSWRKDSESLFLLYGGGESQAC